MPDSFNFSVPGASGQAPAGGRGVAVLVVLIVVLQVALLAVVWSGQQAPGPRVARTSGAALGADARRELALKLEKQGLTESAVAAWQEYLALKGGEKDKPAEIWYRIGTLWQDARQYEKALAAYYTSESFGRLPSLESEIGRRVQESLDALGKYAALRYELKDRTTVGGEAAAGDEVVAEIGPRKITKADLDRIIEGQINDQLERVGRALPLEERDQRKAAMMKQFADNRLRAQMLAQYVTEEVLCRKAREGRLTDDPAVRGRLQEAERSILAGELVAREVTGKVTITPSDVKTYYEANKEAFKVPERARLAHIQVADEEKAKALITSLGEGQSFDELAKSLSQDSPTASRGGALSGPVTAGRDEAPGLGRIEGLSEAVFATAAGSVVATPLRSARGWHVVKVLERLPESQPSFEEAQQDAYQRLSASKQREVQEALIRDLYKTYDVTLHQRALGLAEEGAGEGDQPAAAPAKP